MKVLVTGARGFLGRALLEELRSQGRHEAQGVGREDGDLAGDGVAADVIGRFRPDVVAHFAARVGAAACAGDPVGAVRSNVVATRRVAEACAAAGARLAYASTADVTAATSLYARTKLWGEQLARVFDPEGLQLLRISNPYGPGHGAVARFVERAEERQPIRAYRGETRSWCWVGDAARAIALLLDAPPAVYDVGRDDEPVTMAEAARVACDVAGAPRELVEEVDAPNDRVSVPVSAETLRALGWQPRVSLEEGLRLLVRAPR